MPDAVHFSHKTEEWETPQDFFDKLNYEFHFTIDVCCTHENAKCAKHYTKDDDGLSRNWAGETVWCNPPYGRQMPKWIKKCAEHGKHGGLAVMLIPARTDTKAFHEYIYGKAEIRFVKGRLYFVKQNGESTGRAPFPSMVVVFRPPTIEPEVRRGHWVLTRDEEYEYCHCSECGYDTGENWMIGSEIPYCAQCGSKNYDGGAENG